MSWPAWVRAGQQVLVFRTTSTMSGHTIDSIWTSEIARTGKRDAVVAAAGDHREVRFRGDFADEGGVKIPVGQGYSRRMLHVVLADSPAADLARARWSTQKALSALRREFHHHRDSVDVETADRIFEAATALRCSVRVTADLEAVPS